MGGARLRRWCGWAPWRACSHGEGGHARAISAHTFAANHLDVILHRARHAERQYASVGVRGAPCSRRQRRPMVALGVRSRAAGDENLKHKFLDNQDTNQQTASTKTRGRRRRVLLSEPIFALPSHLGWRSAPSTRFRYVFIRSKLTVSLWCVLVRIAVSSERK